MNIPIYNALMKYSNRSPVSFHMPGHKEGKDSNIPNANELYLMDVTEIPGLDNLHQPEGIIKEAQELAAKAFGADQTFFLVNGSTCGIQAAIMSLCKKGDRLIVGRDCHRAAVSGMMLAGAEPVYIKPEYEDNFKISSVLKISDIEKALMENQDAAGVYITRPNYYGICSDIKEICRLVHSYGKVLIVDEAHGAHLKFSDKLPCSALEHGSDICIQSAHKTLPALTPGAYLHVKGSKVDVEKIRYNLDILQTSSPPYLVMAFLDISRAVMEKDGEQIIEWLLEDIKKFHKNIDDNTHFNVLSKKKLNIGETDGTRLVINTKNYGLSAFKIENILRNKYNIQVEMSDLYNIVCITTGANKGEDLKKLEDAFCDIDMNFKNSPPLADICIEKMDIPEQKVQLDQLMHKSFKRMKLTSANGMISRGMITPYPPGVPVVCPGEVITEGAIEYINDILKFGGNVNGVYDGLEVQVLTSL
ncbi:aminotransferase class V-fold PLP-dependent enzyme [Herbivorax sp. ANBcel31]|uniref:aminotransferase class I/II-fold pyridoxal phosphate-dependent enzyme n=1 Tax=Herbivorax sp. ANBcel31 TaxID=3069754 RepID=UPI0027B1AE0E|nr:aminotransferase class V-fold PLP-dependent enzyme [Herbivorax sp. ANBcel31]MDQ2086372.1 aminotransferase class V-fold PLP-dependent enzyme [Herbivorax sp. ANBcel31]